MNRRRILKTALCAATAVALPVSPLRPGRAQGVAQFGKAQQSQNLRVIQRTIDVNGRAAKVFGLVRDNGAHGLELSAGEMFDVTLRNDSPEATIVHWHGLVPPWEQDGVPNEPLPVLASGAVRRFRFPVESAGTHWMHAHTLQEQSLLAAPLIVFDPADVGRDEQNVVVLLHDFSFTPPEELLARLKGGGGHGSAGGMDHSSMGQGAPATSGGTALGAAGMDLNDIDYDAYLANDRTLDDPETVKVEFGGRVRLRIINGATATAFTIDLGPLPGTLIAVDGQNIVPVNGTRFPIAMGQRLDIRLELPRENRAFPILALREGARERTGIVLAPPNAPVRKLSSGGETAGPVVDLSLEQSLRAGRPLPPHQPAQRFEMALVGGMQGYSWGLESNRDLVVRKETRAEITMRNTSMMAHPMHLHGHHFQVVAVDGRRLRGAVRDTVHVPPHRAVTIGFDANNPGRWAFHCHHLYHMAAGMMATVNYAS